MPYPGNKFLIAVDCVILGFDGIQLQLLLVKRGISPEKGAWSLMGGFLTENEDLDAAAIRVLKSLTGLSSVYMDQLRVYGQRDRDSGGRVLSSSFYALIDSSKQRQNLSSEFEASWFALDELPSLIFDHKKMVSDALSKLKERATTKPIGFNLLPKKFTLPQLQSLYEAIFDKQFDKRNFSKRLLSTGALLKQTDKDKSASKKGAYYYKFNPEMISKDFKFL
jgi:ADP-ribose pyrophosphatase YjhB (NUDIX family)